ALIIDKGIDRENMLYVLEIANLQLEELKALDKRIDRYLDRAYDDMEKPRLFNRRESSSKLRRLREHRMDLAKLNDQVSHSIKFFGDWYLARVYTGASSRFYLEHWKNSVERRISQLDSLYTVFSHEVSENRMVWLEVSIVVLFIIDIIALFFFE